MHHFQGWHVLYRFSRRASSCTMLWRPCTRNSAVEYGASETWGEGLRNGKPIRSRWTETIISPRETSLKFEQSNEGGPWTVMYVSKNKKRP